MKQLCLLISFVICIIHSVSSQYTIHNFTATDSDNNTFNLYDDLLDEGKTVVIKFFFTTCPPCIALAPAWQQKYVAWGEGDYDVEFIEPSILSSDNNLKVKNYKIARNLTMRGIGSDGNASAIVNPFQLGSYGSWYGTPSFAVIAPDGSMQFPVEFSDLDAAIAATGAQMPGGNDLEPIQVSIVNQFYKKYNKSHYDLYLKPQNASQPKIKIDTLTNGNWGFVYPSTKYPEMVDPIIVFESSAPAYSNSVSAADIIEIRKHILGLGTITNPVFVKAADVNSDTKISAQDILFIQKVILGIDTNFQGGTKSYQSIPPELSLSYTPGQNVNFEISIFKTGDVTP